MHLLMSLAMGLVLASEVNAPQWIGDYGIALEQTALDSKPLLIVIDDPKVAEGRIEQVSYVSDAAQAQLLANYTLCHVDATTPYGQKVAEAFDAPGLPFTAIIDKTGSRQIYRNAGTYTPEQWSATLTTHRKGEIPARAVSSSNTRTYVRSYCPSCR